MNWDDPTERFHLIERVGHEEYNRLFKQHLKDSAIETVNGYAIRPVSTRFGRLFSIVGTTTACSTLDAAREHARDLPPAKAQP